MADARPEGEWPAAILHVDMDAFFVGVHLLDHPEDRGLAVAVGGSPDGRGVVTSASYEARRFGVRSAMPTRTALRLCPRLKVVGANWARIAESSSRIVEVLGRFGPVEPVSVDEAYVDLSGEEEVEAVAGRAVAAVTDETSLSCSAGLATSKLVAKVASEAAKPGGFRVVPPGSEAAFLAPLPVRAIWGIGPRTSERLEELGIVTCGDLADADPKHLSRTLGPHAASWPELGRGIDGRRVRVGRSRARSISCEHTFARDVADPDVAAERMGELCRRVASRLGRAGLEATTVIVKLRWSDFSTVTRRRRLPAAIDAEEDLRLYSVALLRANWRAGGRVRLVGVGVTGLSDAGPRQLGLGWDR